jgi:lysophospholipase L1-like esterase
MPEHQIGHSMLTVLGMGLAVTLGACQDGEPTHKVAAVGGMSATAGETSEAGSPGETSGGTSAATNAVEGGSANGGSSAAGSGVTTSVPGCASPVEAEGFVDVPYDDPAIRYVGRGLTTSNSVMFAFPASQIQTIFEGDAIDMRLRDFGLDRPTWMNLYWIIVDGWATKLRVCQESDVYPLARNLGPGPHSLTIVKRTESSLGGLGSAGRGEFFGFRVRPGTVLTPVATPQRLLEFVGDSITCGYGDEVSTTDPDSYQFTSVNEDAWNTYGAITARAFAADYVAVAESGRGLIRNYGGFTGPVVPELYERTLPDDSFAPLWDHTRYSPDVVVVNLGTNDFSPGIALDQLESHRTAFRQGYIAFLSRIRVVHPAASIIAVVGPMLNDSFPEGYAAWTSIQTEVAAAVEARHAANDIDVHYFALAPQEGPYYGEDWHPTIATHQAMADALVPFIAGVRGW